MDLSERQKRLERSLDIVVADMGAFDQSAMGDGAHYADGDENPFRNEGMICGNCVAFKGNRMCRWVAGDIDPLGICRLWIIPQDAIKEFAESEDEEEHSEEEDSYEEEDDSEEEDMPEGEDSYDEHAMTKASFSPPRGVQIEARRALEWIKQGHAGDGFTDVGRKRASDLARGAAVSLDTIKRMNSFLARHAVDSQGKGWSPGQEGYPSPGRVAYAAWGGKPALSWVSKILRSQENG
jgi:hypothetical protein